MSMYVCNTIVGLCHYITKFLTLFDYYGLYA